MAVDTIGRDVPVDVVLDPLEGAVHHGRHVLTSVLTHVLTVVPARAHAPIRNNGPTEIYMEDA